MSEAIKYTTTKLDELNKRVEAVERDIKLLKESKVDDQTKFLKEKMSTVVSTQNKLNNRNQQLIHALQTQVQQLTNQLKRR